MSVMLYLLPHTHTSSVFADIMDSVYQGGNSQNFLLQICNIFVTFRCFYTENKYLMFFSSC